MIFTSNSRALRIDLRLINILFIMYILLRNSLTHLPKNTFTCLNISVLLHNYLSKYINYKPMA